MPTMNLIVIDRATPEVLNAAHAIIKAHANGWWHRMANAWIVGGEVRAPEWRDHLKRRVKPPTSVLVLRLPERTEERGWAYFGPYATTRASWLHNVYRPRVKS